MILIIDPNTYEVSQIKKEMEDVYPDSDIVAVASAADAMQYIISEKVDVCFMDPLLDRISSSRVIEVLRRFRHDVKVNFIADTDEYALMGWNLHINDYLMRPLTAASFEHARERAEAI